MKFVTPVSPTRSYLIQPTRIRNSSKTLIDNIYTNVITLNSISNNGTKFDRFPQFLITPGIFSNPPCTKSNIFERDWSKFDRENFFLEYPSIDWESLIHSSNTAQEMKFSIKDFFSKCD